MAIRHLLNLARRSPKSARNLRSLSTSSAAVAEPSPTTIINDSLAGSVIENLKTLQKPDQRFLKYSSPNPVLTDHTKILRYPLTRITTLPSGLRVATESNLASRMATVGVWIDAGSRFETDETNGTAHFLEHMIFKGTDKRSARDLEEEIENLGGHLNAYTSRESTTYYANFMAEDVPKALDILADVLQNSKFEDFSIERERQVILREMQEVESQTSEVIFDYLHATAFQHSPLGRTILGPVENIKTITKKHLQDYIATHYTAPRMVVVGSGAVKHEELVKQVETTFTKLSSDPTTTSELAAKEPSIFTGSEGRLQEDGIPLAHFAVAFKGACSNDPDSIGLMVIQALLSSWSKDAGAGKHMGSAQTVGINEVAESFSAFNTNYKDTGLFGVYATAKPDCLGDLADAIMYEIGKLSSVQEEDVIRACNQLKSSFLLHMDGSSAIAEEIGRQLLTYGRRIPMAELFARIDAVDVSTVKCVANRFMRDRDVAVAAIGPLKGLPDHNWFRRRTILNYE